MRIENQHASVYAGVVVADHLRRGALLSIAGPKTAVKAIHASLRGNTNRWLKVYEEGAASSSGVVCGGLRYETKSTNLPAVKGVQMVLSARDNQAPVGFAHVPKDGRAGLVLARALDTDPRLVIPVLPEWGGYLLEEGLETDAVFPEVVEDAPQRLVTPLDVYSDNGEIGAAYAYARDNDSWMALLNRGLSSGHLALDDEDIDPAWVLSEQSEGGKS